MNRLIGSMSATWISAGLGMLLDVERTGVFHFISCLIVVGAAAGIGFILGAIADGVNK